MKNEIICTNCGSANAPHSLTCTNCNSYLRERVVNIDLWHTLGLLTVTPSIGFKLIRNSEHKNFIYLLFIIVAVKILQNTMFLSMFHYKEPVVTSFIIRNMAIVSGVFLVLAVAFSFALKISAQISKFKLRFWDNFAILMYSFFPYTLALIVFLPLEYIIFAEYLFSLNPSWFSVNPSLAYLFSFLELGCFLWSAFLLYCGIKTQTDSKLFSASLSLVFIFITYLTYFVLSKYLFM